jgi:hypothetical protein
MGLGEKKLSACGKRHAVAGFNMQQWDSVRKKNVHAVNSMQWQDSTCYSGIRRGKISACGNSRQQWDVVGKNEKKNEKMK